LIFRILFIELVVENIYKKKIRIGEERVGYVYIIEADMKLLSEAVLLSYNH
jgi:hypothetical protein